MNPFVFASIGCVVIAVLALVYISVEAARRWGVRSERRFAIEDQMLASAGTTAAAASVERMGDFSVDRELHRAFHRLR